MRVDACEVKRRVERFKATARADGIRLTHQRLVIYQELASSLEHPDAETVYRAVRPQIPTVSLDTVYRTLWRLGELGLITNLGVRRSVRFDANVLPHPHYVCIRCGRTADLEHPVLGKLAIADHVEGLGSVVATHVEVHGVCDRCGGKRSGRRAKKRNSA